MLLVGGRLCVSWDVLSEFVMPTFLPAQQFFLPLSFCLLFCVEIEVISALLRVKLLSPHPTPISNGGFALYPSLWGMGARPVYGSFQLTGLGVCLLGCQVRLKRSIQGFAFTHSHPTFYRKIPFFLTTQVFFL